MSAAFLSDGILLHRDSLACFSLIFCDGYDLAFGSSNLKCRREVQASYGVDFVVAQLRNIESPSISPFDFIASLRKV